MIFLKANWSNIIMANYPVPADLLQSHLPKGLSLNTYEGTAFISLVGFLFTSTKLFNIPIPYLGNFEEINLRFYVHETDNKDKQGVVFINETIPYKPVAWLANKLYHESYSTVPTRHSLVNTPVHKEVSYQWKVAKKWNTISVHASNVAQVMKPHSLEAFIFENYTGYTKVNENTTEKYTINHPAWQVQKVLQYTIDCDFGAMYGQQFAYLSTCQPLDVFMAQGSPISINWKRVRLQ